MSIGLCGAHGTGKTTLAKAVSERCEVPLVLTTTKQVFADLGLDPKADYPFDVRLDIQERILAELEKQWAAAGANFITDRTPIDLLAYTLADVRRETLTPALEERLERYRKACVRAANRYFSVLIVVQPGIKLVDHPGRGPMSQGYIEHHAALVLGLVVSEDVQVSHYYIPKRMVTLGARVGCVVHAVNRNADQNDRRMKEAREAGVSLH